MKEILDIMPERVLDEDNFANRKLIRPTLPRVEPNGGNHNGTHGLANHGSANHSSVNHGSANHGPANHNSLHLQIAERRERHDRTERAPERSRDHGERTANGKKAVPPEQTNAENFYYQKQMRTRTPMVVVLQDGEEVHGIIEWYDKTCIKVVRDDGGPNLMIYKPAIKYMFKAEERGR